MKGYTLIELLVVLAIIAILAIFVFANYKDFSSGQVLIRATSQIQSLLRLAQTNASSNVLCNGISATEWFVVFTNSSSTSTVDLYCKTTTENKIKTVTLAQGVTFDPSTYDPPDGSSCSAFPEKPFIISYQPLVGKINFSIRDAGSSRCNIDDAVQKVTIPIKYAINNSTGTFVISKGGGIDVN